MTATQTPPQKDKKKQADPKESVLVKALQKATGNEPPKQDTPTEEPKAKSPEFQQDPFNDVFFTTPKVSLDDDAGDDDGDKKETPTEPEKQEKPTEDADQGDVEIDVEELTNLRGQKITQKAADAFKIVKKSRDEWKQKALDLEKKLTEKPDTQQDSPDSEAYKQLLAERDAYKAQLQEIDYGNSEEFKSAYVEPVSQVVQRINGLLPKNLSDVEKAQLAKLAGKASSLAGISDKEDEYFSTVDTISERFFSGSLGTRFQRAMDELWEKSVVLEDAKKSKSESARKILEDRKKQIDGSSDQFLRSIDEELSTFEKMEERRVKVWGTEGFKDEIQYDKFKETELSNAKRMLVEFAKTGKLNSDTRKLLMVGVLGPVFAREKTALLRVIDIHHKELKAARDKVAELEDALKKRSSKIGDFRQDGEKKDETPAYEKGGSIIHQNIKKARI